VVPAGKLKKLLDSLSELRSSLGENRRERSVLRPLILSVKTAQVYSVFPSVVTSHNKIALINRESIGRLTVSICWMVALPQ
jgi:hypothetical protein